MFDVSNITIRRDTDKLENMGLINKILGGVEIKDNKMDIDYDIRSKKNLPQKKTIAKKASKFLQNNSLIFLDSGTTIYEIIPYLKNRNIKVVTNSYMHINALLDNGIDFIILGGKVKKLTKAIIGVVAIKQMQSFNFDISFIGANGVDKEKGYTTPDIDEAEIKRIAIEKSKKAYILADESKYNKIYSIIFQKFDDSKVEWIK